MDSNDSMDVTSATASTEGPTDKEISQSVQVAVHIRPLIAQERVQGCKECISVVPGEPQVQLSTHSFTFDHVYGSGASPPSAIFEESVAPLVEGLFHGYNATVLAYGQTGSGKTYTMGTGYTVGGCADGIIPQVMDKIFRHIESLRQKSDFQLRVSFIEILKEEVHDLLDPNPPTTAKPEISNFGGYFLGAKAMAPGKPPIQIRETTNGGITLAGVTEVGVNSLQEMASCLEQGSLCRATGSTNMNSSSSRSHAIFTINLEQRRKWDASLINDSAALLEDGGEDFLCAKLHLVDLAGSERVKRTGADGMRFKEGVHINKGLLALGNVISALGDDKKRKENGHVPYRDSKLTRLLQDSLGGNSRTVMIACVSPADSNAEETLNTLKYANRARNIQNKPTVNRDPMAAEMQRMRQQLELLRAELMCARAAGCYSEEIEILKQKVSWLEAGNLGLRHELQQALDSSQKHSDHALSAQLERDKLQLKLEQLRNGKTLSEIDEDGTEQGVDLLKVHLSRIQELEREIHHLKASGQVFGILQSQSVLSSMNSGHDSELPNLDYALLAEHDLTVGVTEGSGGAEMEAVAAKELEHNLLQDCLDKELQELNKRLEQKEAEMKTFARSDTAVLKQHFEKKLIELEEEKKSLQRERDNLLAELDALASTSDEQTQKMQDAHRQKLKELEYQIFELKKKQENQSQLLKQKQRSDEVAKHLQDDILRIKQHKVQLQNKIKQESEQFRSWKALREKEIVQLRKEGRRNEYEMHKLQALHQRQKMVLQRKTEEAAMATRRLKEVLEARKSTPRENPLQSAASASGANLSNEKALHQWLDHELEVAVRVHEVRIAYEKQCDSRSALATELAKLKEIELHQKDSDGCLISNQDGTPVNKITLCSSALSPSARHARVALLESMLNTSSSALVAMASQLSEAEERERVVSGRARWQNVRSIRDAKNLLNVMLSNVVSARCELRDKELEIKEIKERIAELDEALKRSESLRQETEKQQRLKEQAVAVALATATKAGVDAAVKRGVEELSAGLSQFTGLGKRHFQDGDNCFEPINPGESCFPYALRQAPRNHKSPDIEESESSEWEIDMDLDDSDQSDKDWQENEERCSVKWRGLRVGKRHHALERKISSDSSNKQSDYGSAEDWQRVGSKATSFSDEGPSEENEQKSKSVFDGCCSCGLSSGCKTKKCECKAAGSFCGHKCGCKSTKCANREGFEVDVDSCIRASVTDVGIVGGIGISINSDLNKHGSINSGFKEHGSSTTGDTLLEKTISEEQSLATQGARLLESAWKEESQDIQSDREDEVEQHGIEDPNKQMQRRPLSDIGNTKGSRKNQAVSKQSRRLPRALIQIVPSGKSISVSRSDSVGNAPEPVVSAPLPTINNVSSSSVSGKALVGSSDVLVDANLKGDTSMPNTQLQNVERKRPVGSRQGPQKGVNMDENAVVNRRFLSGLSSPDKPSRHKIDKENMR